MKVIIIEDEELAAMRLEKMIRNYDRQVDVLARLESVSSSVEWFNTHEAPDLIFLDIHLEDDISFAIFNKVKVTCPIIFTTAFDEYAIKAFKLRSIDYLLKPIVQEELNAAIEKYKAWTSENRQVFDLSALFDMIGRSKTQYRERYPVNVGQMIRSVSVKEVAYFVSTSGITFMTLGNNTQYTLDQSLDAVAAELDPQDFFRVNRQYLVSLGSVKQVHVYPKSRLKLELFPVVKEEVFVSIDKVTAFKEWYGGAV